MMTEVKRSSVQINESLWGDLDTLSMAKKSSYTPTKYMIPVPLKDTHYLLFNGLTGAIDIINANDYKRLFCAEGGKLLYGGTPRKIGGAVTLSDSDKILLDRGYFLTPEEEEQIERKLNAQISVEADKEPMCFFLAPTNYCSVGCTYCIESENPKSAQRVSLDPERVDAAFESMATLMKKFNRDSGYILLFGGEPMQPYSFETVQNILDACRKTNLKIFCFTSGISLKRFAPMLGSYLDVLLGVCVTLDGRPEFHDQKRAIKNGFNQASNGIDELLKYSIPTMIRTNVSKDSLDQIPWLRNFYVERGWWENNLCSFELNILTNHGSFEGLDDECPTHTVTANFFLELMKINSDYQKFRFVGLFSHLYYGVEKMKILNFHPEELGLHAKVPRMYGCPSTGVFTFTLDADGSIRMCNEQVGSKDKPVGRFFPYFDLDEAHVKLWKNRTPDVLDLCKDCNHRFFCGGGCSLRSMRDSLESNEKDGYSDISNGICGSLQQDFQDFFGSKADTLIDQYEVSSQIKGLKI
jgi:uncharacterized protein